MGELRLRDIRKSFGAVDVIKGVDLDIKSGEFVVFVGPSGCGKSTLLRLIAGLEEITSGTLEFDGEEVNELPPALRGIAMVFQSYALYPHMTVYNNMAFGMKLAKASKDGDRQERPRGRRNPAAHAVSRPPPEAALRRSAAARRHRPRHRPQSEGLPLRRAALQPRRGAARLDAHRDRQAARAHDRRDHGLRHPRPGRGDDARRPHRRAARRNRRAGRLADGALSPAGQSLRRRLHRLAGDEHGALHRSRRRRRASDRRSTARCTSRRRFRRAPSGKKGTLGVRPENLSLANGVGEPIFKGTLDIVEHLGELTLLYVDCGYGEPIIAKLEGSVQVKRDSEVALDGAGERAPRLRRERQSLRAHELNLRGALPSSAAKRVLRQDQRDGEPVVALLRRRSGWRSR